MKQKLCAILLTIVFLSSCNNRKEGLLSYVDTRIGAAPSITKTAGMFGKSTEEYGQTMPAVLEPYGMNFWTAQTQDTEQKCKAPYYYKDTRIQGFRNSHWLTGSCTQDYGSMTLMPLSGILKCQPQDRGSLFSHADEIATPAYYSVFLEDYDIRAEMTGRSRSAIFRFTYPQEGSAWLVVNPNSDEGEGFIEIDTEKKQIRGYNPVHRIYQGWGEPAGFSSYFIIQYENEIEEYGTFHNDSLFAGKKQIAQSTRIGAYIRFKLDGGGQILLKAASSFTSMEGAQKNLEAEIPHWNFEQTRQELTGIWEQRLSKIDVQTDIKNDKELFYGALYRASFLPHAINDVDGCYPSFSQGTPIRQMEEGKSYYDDFSLWDTYRALHPLITILTPRKAGEMMQSLVTKYEQGGWLPIFPCWNSYTAAMIGDHCISVLGDAYLKGIRNFDIDKAYKGMRQNSFESPVDYKDYEDGMGRRALKSYREYGYIPLEDPVKEAFHQGEQVSRTLEYAYDDFVLSLVAKSLGKTDDYAVLAQRAMNYKNIIDPGTGYAQGRHVDGSFLKEDNAFGFAPFITEGAPCHYTWYVPHDVNGLMECMGGKQNYISKLDSMFTEGRYWHGNEPCHQVAFMFNYAGQPWKTQREVRHIMQTEYLNEPGGLSGNDDAGQMAAWYIFAAMGFYPVCPGTPYYILASPTFPHLSIKLENGKTFTIKAPNASPENIYIQSARLNGKVYTRNYISHEDILSGGIFEFVMGETPNKEWGAAPEDCPPSYGFGDASTVPAQESDLREKIMQSPQKMGSIYYAYPQPTDIQSPAPEGYTPFYVSHYGRHGSRWMNSEEHYWRVIRVFDSFYERSGLTSLGEDVRLRLYKVLENAQGHDGELSPLGERQHKAIAKRLYQNYPQIFSKGAVISARSSISPRCIMSMAAFSEQLKELDPSLQVVREASPRDMNYIAYTSPELQEWSSKETEWKRELKNFEEENIHPERLMRSLFKHPEQVENARLLMTWLYWIAAVIQDIELPVTFYDIFEKEELFTIWQTVNGGMYAANAAAPSNKGIAPLSAASLLGNIIESADRAIREQTPCATLRFGHDTNLIRLLALMQVEGCSGQETDPKRLYRTWQDFHVAPMAGNLQLIFYRNSQKDILVKVLHNENEVGLPVDSATFPFYKWEKVKELYSTILEDR